MSFKLVSIDNNLFVKWIGRHNKCIAKALVAKVRKTNNGYVFDVYQAKSKFFKDLSWKFCNIHHYNNARLSIINQI